MADPRLAQVMEAVLNDKAGTGLKLMEVVAAAVQPAAAPMTVYAEELTGVTVKGFTAKLPGRQV